MEVKCIRCGNVWMLELKEKNRVVYRNGKEVRRERYRERCPACGTMNVVTVEIEEADDD